MRLAVGALAGFFLLFGIFQGYRFLSHRRADYQKLVVEARELNRELEPYKGKADVAQRLMDTLHLDPAKLGRATVVSEASAAIQKAATSEGLQLGPIRESPARNSAKELTSMQLEGTGPVSSVLTFLHRCESLGFPVILDSVALNPDPARPTNLKMRLTVIILDFDQWKGEERSNV